MVGLVYPHRKVWAGCAGLVGRGIVGIVRYGVWEGVGGFWHKGGDSPTAWECKGRDRIREVQVRKSEQHL